MKITRRLEFDAGHRVMGHGGKCASPHGHRYVVEVTCSAPTLDDLGMVMDFGCIKEKLGTWLDDEWDHGMVLDKRDPLIERLFGYKVYELPYNPTAENMAKYLAEEVWPNLMFEHAEDVHLVSVRVWETPNCSATWTAP